MNTWRNMKGVPCSCPPQVGDPYQADQETRYKLIASGDSVEDEEPVEDSLEGEEMEEEKPDSDEDNETTKDSDPMEAETTPPSRPSPQVLTGAY